MNEQEIRELLKLVRGIEHYLERALKTITEKQLKEQGVEITSDPTWKDFEDGVWTP